MAIEAAADLFAKYIVYPTLGRLTKSWYDKVTGRYWELPIEISGSTRRTWEWILNKVGKEPTDLYVAAADLSFISPFLSDLSHIPKYRNKIKNVCVKHMSKHTFDYLANPTGGSGPHIDSRMFGRLQENLAATKDRFGPSSVKESEWPGLPPYHGVLYGDYLSYHPWIVDV